MALVFCIFSIFNAWMLEDGSGLTLGLAARALPQQSKESTLPVGWCHWKGNSQCSRTVRNGDGLATLTVA